MTSLTLCPSPNFDERPQNTEIDLLILHYTGMPGEREALGRLCEREAKVSAHYFIRESGEILQLVHERHRAWHAGLAWWKGSDAVNARSIGIEIVNPGHEFGYRPFTDAQMKALIPLCRDIIARHSIPADRVLGHSDVAPLRKEDPGELFDWQQLAAAGIGLWPGGLEKPTSHRPDISKEKAVRLLQDIGYGFVKEDLKAVVRAFQRHWRPSQVNGILDQETRARIKVLASCLDETRKDPYL